MRTTTKKLDKITIRLEEGDRALIERFWPTMPTGIALRALINKHLRLLVEKENETRIVGQVELETQR